MGHFHTTRPDQSNLHPTAEEALEGLCQGNARYLGEQRHLARAIGNEQRAEIVAAQRPFATILGCSDSRVPPEIIFDQGLGELFIVRVAGNIVTPPQLDSVEYSVMVLGVRLVVVLGHTGCGAVAATIEAIRRPDATSSQRSSSILEGIRPAVEPLLRGKETGEPPVSLARQATRANVRSAVDRLRHDSESLGHLLRRGELAIVGAEYDLATGQVDFFAGSARRLGIDPRLE